MRFVVKFRETLVIFHSCTLRRGIPLLIKHWRQIKLLKRLIVLIVVFLIVPILLIGYFLFSKSLQLAQQENREILEKVIYQLNENMEYRITGYQNMIMQMAIDPHITTSLTQSYHSLEDVVMALQQINAVTNRISTYFPMQKIQFFKNNPSLYADGGVVLDLEQAHSRPWFPAMEQQDQPFYWYFDWENEGASPTLHLSKWQVDLLTGERFGLIHVEVTNRALFHQLFNPLAFKNGIIMVTDQNGKALISSQNTFSNHNVSATQAYASVFTAREGTFGAQIDGEQSLVMFTTNRLGWKIITVVKQEELWQQLRFIRNTAIGMSILFVVLTLTVLIGYGRRISKRLNALIRQMRKVRAGDLGLSAIVHGQDELTDVEEEFNTMTLRLNTLVKESADARLAAETEKLRLLQAQINPHFLYNTLALVKSMAMDVQSREISETIDALAKFFRLALNRGSDVLPLQEELEHVRAYLDIHNKRYPDRLQTIWEIDEQALSCSIIKITLQPLVENALEHAFKHRGGRGCVRIKVHLQEKRLKIVVQDDGSGIPPDILEPLQIFLKGLTEHPRQETEKAFGFGIYNVRERLARHYGERCRMHIHSLSGRGTSVFIEIPV